jgi:hypothetical protein
LHFTLHLAGFPVILAIRIRDGSFALGFRVGGIVVVDLAQCGETTASLGGCFASIVVDLARWCG